MKKTFYLIAIIGIILGMLMSLALNIHLFYLLIFSLFYLICLFIIYKFILFKNKKNNSINIFLERIDKDYNKKIENVSRYYEFNRNIKYKKSIIPLGKICFDDINKDIFIYETFYNKDNHIVCLPDIRIFKYNDLIECNLYEKNKLINIGTFDNKIGNINKNNDIVILLKIKNNFYNHLKFHLSSINDSSLFREVYYEFKNIIKK